MYRTFDTETWNRRTAFHFFRNYDDPFFGVCSPLDITWLYRFCKAHGHSLHLALLYCSLRAANEQLEFRLRLQGDEVLLFDQIDGGTTILHEDHTFSFCFIPYNRHAETFMLQAKESIERQDRLRDPDPNGGRQGVMYFSAFPWAAFTYMKNARHSTRDDSIPKVNFGKFTEEAGRFSLPFNIEVHHALMDGYHLGVYLLRLQALVDGEAFPMGQA